MGNCYNKPSVIDGVIHTNLSLEKMFLEYNFPEVETWLSSSLKITKYSELKTNPDLFTQVSQLYLKNLAFLYVRHIIYDAQSEKKVARMNAVYLYSLCNLPFDSHIFNDMWICYVVI